MREPDLEGFERELEREPVDWRYKGLPPAPAGLRIKDIGAQKWNLFAGDMLPPVMLLRSSALDHNLNVMAQYCRTHGVWLAPHGKTTMSPQLFSRQLDAGAWGITAATPSQVVAYRAFGIRRIILANQLVDPVALRWVAAEQRKDPDFELLCLVDSERGVRLMDAALDDAKADRRLGVLVEVGYQGGRAGCRSGEGARAVAESVRNSAHLELRGVEGFEGLIAAAESETILAAVDTFLHNVQGVAITLDEAGYFRALDEIMLTAGGSAFFDRAVAYLSGLNLSRPVRTILRSGCYITHDGEMYEELSPLAGRSTDGLRLRPALELWATVWSRPEAGLAIVGFGKRDAAYDYRLPVVEAVRSAETGEIREVSGHMEIVDLNDQHARVRLPDSDPLAVGDLVRCGISHPCAAFDKWALIPVVDDDYTVTGAIRTFF